VIELVDDDVPDNFGVNARVFVNQDVPQSGDLLPLYFRGLRSDFGSQVLDRLTNDFEVADDCVNSALVRLELIEAQISSVAANLRDRVQNVLEVDPS
jgi:hypothetical protein